MAQNTTQKYIIELIAQQHGIKENIKDLNKLEQAVSQFQKKSSTIFEVTGGGVSTPPGYSFTQSLYGGKGGWRGPSGKFIKASEVPKAYSVEMSEVNLKKETEAINVNAKALTDLNKISKDSITSHMNLAKRAIAVIPIWMALRATYMLVISSIQNGIKFLIEFETALAQIKIVGKGTEEDYTRLGDSVMTFATLYGISASKSLEAAKIFAQQGLKINEVISMTRTAMIGAAVLGEDVTKVSEDLTAAVRAYNINMTDSLSIVDKWMKVQKEFAVTSKDLAEATKTAGSTAASFGISYDKFLGQITAIIEVTRKTGSQAANALQMVYTRLFTVAGKAVQEIAKVPIYQDQAGKAVMETTHIYRSSEEVLDDLAIAWQKLTEAQKIQLASQLGSRRQVAPFIALMNNYNRSIEAQVASLTSAGDALTSFNILQNTTQVKLKQMQNTWSELAKTIGDTSLFKVAIDMVKNLAEAFIFLANSTEYAALKMREGKQREIDALSLTKSRIDSLNQLSKLEIKLAKNPETNRELLNRVKATKEQILAANPELALMDVKSLEYKTIRDEVERDRAKEIQTLRSAQMSGNVIPGLFTLDFRRQRDKDRLIKQYGSLKNAEKSIMGGVEKEVKARLAEKGVSGLISEAEEEKYGEAVDKVIEKQKEVSALVQHRANILSNLGMSEENVLRYLILQYETNETLKNSEDARTKLTQLRYELEEKITSQIKEQRDVLKTGLEESFKELMGGGSFLSTLNEKITTNYRSVVSEGFTKMIMATGIGDLFSGSFMNIKTIFGGASSKIESAFDSGGKLTYNWIIRGFSDATSGTGTTSIAGMASSFNSTGIAGTSTILTTMGGGNTIVGGVGGTNTGYQIVNGKKVPTWSPYNAQGKRVSKGNAATIGAQSAIIAYSSYQSAKAGGASTGQAIGSSALSTVGMALMMAGGPVGMIIGGLMMLGGMLLGRGKKGSQVSIEEKSTENRVASKIDVTNRSLEVINRNLVALRSDITTYILPASAYFSERRNVLEDQFAINSMRAYNG